MPTAKDSLLRLPPVLRLIPWQPHLSPAKKVNRNTVLDRE